MKSVRPFRWGVSALVLCAGLAALQSGVAQEATEGNETREEGREESALDEERWEKESKRDREREERGERGRRGGEGGGEYGGGGGGYGGGGYGRGFGGGYGAPGRGPKPKETLGAVKIQPNAILNLTKKFALMQAQPETMNRIREAAKALVDAEDDDAREDAERNLNEQLDGYFEEDMKRREEELAGVERRVKELRELLERRREKKDDIIRLQVEVLQNEANGLGFFSAEGAGGASGGNVLFWQGPAAALPLGHPPVQAVPATPYAPGAPPTPPVVAPVAAPARR